MSCMYMIIDNLSVDKWILKPYLCYQFNYILNQSWMRILLIVVFLKACCCCCCCFLTNKSLWSAAQRLPRLGSQGSCHGYHTCGRPSTRVLVCTVRSTALSNCLWFLFFSKAQQTWFVFPTQEALMSSSLGSKRGRTTPSPQTISGLHFSHGPYHSRASWKERASLAIAANVV